MIYIAADPGDRSPCHCLRTSNAAPRFRRTPFRVNDPERVAVFLEGQYFNRHKRINVVGFGTLRFFAGMVGGAYKMQGCVVYVLDPMVWREAILPGSARVPKTVLHNRAARAGFFDGIEFPKNSKGSDEDAKDAYLMTVAGARLLRAGLLPEPLEWCEHARKRRDAQNRGSADAGGKPGKRTRSTAPERKRRVRRDRAQNALLPGRH